MDICSDMGIPTDGLMRIAAHWLISTTMVGLFALLGCLFAILGAGVAVLGLWLLSLLLLPSDDYMMLGLIIFFVILYFAKIALYCTVIASTITGVEGLNTYQGRRAPAGAISKSVAFGVAGICMSESVCLFVSIIASVSATSADTAFMLTCLIYALNTVWALVFGALPAVILWAMQPPPVASTAAASDTAASDAVAASAVAAASDAAVSGDAACGSGAAELAV